MKIKQSKNIFSAKLFWSLFVVLSLLSSSYLFVQNSKFSHNSSLSISEEQVGTGRVVAENDYRTRDFNIYNNVIYFVRQLLY